MAGNLHGNHCSSELLHCSLEKGETVSVNPGSFVGQFNNFLYRLSIINFFTDWPPISCPEEHQSNIRMWEVNRLNNMSKWREQVSS